VRLQRLLVLVALIGCHRPDAAVHASEDDAQTRAAIDRFVAAGRTPEAFAALANDLDKASSEAEVRLLALAQPIAEAARRSSVDDEIAALGLTVWPALLDVAAHPDESTRTYVARLCEGPLATECRDLAPEYQPMAVRAAAMRRGSERMRAALATCIRCGLASESGWREIGWKWESLARGAARDFLDVPARPQQASLDRRRR
jgi:hypothetical protein